MDPVKNMVGDYEDEVAGEVKKAKKGGPASSSEEIVDNIL